MGTPAPTSAEHDETGHPPPGRAAPDTDAGRNPTQQQVVALLGRSRADWPDFDAGLRHELRAELEAGLAPVADRLPEGDDLFLSKHALTGVHGCEASYLADLDAGFAWTVPMARGQVAHKAIELSVHWRGESVPLQLVDEALARLEHADSSLADWLQTLTEVELAELRSAANERVAKFLESFPTLKSAWRPVLESPATAELCDGRVVLRGRVDLTLGRAEGTRPGKVLVDLKTGTFSPNHVDDLRFYALVETLRLGTPPRLLATFYLDSGTPRPEEVTEAVLDAAVRAHRGGGRPAGRAPDTKPPIP
ncbi:MAG: PD-(D/E)XK nuclease family protein [Acidimicrobiia bacterium]|nr:PD-(D/E)XK nuclease family protein [Acidimicrobiia bacterium]